MSAWYSVNKLDEKVGHVVQITHLEGGDLADCRAMGISLPMPFLELQDKAVPVQEDGMACVVSVKPAPRCAGEVRACKSSLVLIRA